MRLNSLWKWLVFVIIIIIIIGGTIVVIIVRGPFPPDPPPCLVCGMKGLKYLGIAEIILGVVSLGLINRIRNNQKIN